MAAENGRTPELDALFWREEILQVLFWMEGEGLADAATCDDLRSFLHGDHETIARHLEKCTLEGYLVRRDDRGEVRYALSEQGKQEGGRLFAQAFAGMQKQGHGECSPDCICYEEGPEACPAHSHDHAQHS